MSSSSRIARSILTTKLPSFKTTIPISRLSSSSFVTKSNIISSRAFPRSFHTTTVKMGVHNIESKVAFTEALKNDIVVLDCFATWCGPCKVIAPQVVKYSDEYPNVHFIKLDVDEVPDVAQELGIRAMPTFLIFKNGEKVGEIVGANPPALKAAIEKAAGEKKE